MSIQTTTRCSNPFFPCKNTNPKLKIILDIQVKGEKYEICECCWPIISESEEYQWTQPRVTEEHDQPLEVNWKQTETTEPED
jgi:hypothetical protein